MVTLENNNLDRISYGITPQTSGGLVLNPQRISSLNGNPPIPNVSNEGTAIHISWTIPITLATGTVCAVVVYTVSKKIDLNTWGHDDPSGCLSRNKPDSICGGR